MARGIQAGDKAPDFTLPSQSGEPVRHVFNPMTNIGRHVGDALDVVRQLQSEPTA